MNVAARFFHRLSLRSKGDAAFALLLIGGLALRVVYCFLTTPYTTDLLRNLGYGKAFSEYGFLLYDITAFDLSPQPCQFMWHNYHYTYPPMTMLLFAAIAFVHTSLAWGKIVLTFFDGLSAWAISRASGDRWLGLLYWLNPISIWYTSREGQFEGSVVFWTVCALWALKRKKPWAFGLLGIAVQTKLFPVFLGPLFMKAMSWKAPKRLAKEFAWGIASFLPSVLAYIWGGYPHHLMEQNYVPPVNPLTWKLADPTLYVHFPYWIVIFHYLSSIGFLLFCLYGVKRTRRVVPWLAPMLFVFAIPFSKMAQFWYYMLLPAFCLPVEDKKLRRILFLWCIAFGSLILYSIFIGLTGYQNPPDAMVIIKKAFWGF